MRSMTLRSVLDPIPLQSAQVVRVAELAPQLFEDRPVSLLRLVSDLTLEVPIEIGRDAIVVDEGVVHVDQEYDRIHWPSDRFTIAWASRTMASR